MNASEWLEDQIKGGRLSPELSMAQLVAAAGIIAPAVKESGPRRSSLPRTAAGGHLDRADQQASV